MQKIAAIGITTLAVVGMAGFGTYSVSAMQGPNARSGETAGTHTRQIDGTGDQARVREHAQAAVSETERDTIRAQNQADCDGTGMQQHQRLHATED
ncbi:hypothetical protein KDA14_02600 [Candidatus Saccharibacteria bacterium]|nr:hypothetical protein [Candidatus Saccharibacteria bacterium]